MGNGGSTKKCSTEKKCSYFTLEVFEKYLIKLDIFFAFYYAYICNISTLHSSSVVKIILKCSIFSWL